jgi:2-iminobutanoate/2-iminopropanoate deaminase
MKKVIATNQAPAAIGPYSQAIQAGNMLFVSGQVSIDPATGNIDAVDITGQTKQSFNNLEAILTEAGYTMEDVVKTTVFLADMSLFAEMNDVYKARFTGAFPARSAVAAKGLPKGALVEIEAIAIK